MQKNAIKNNMKTNDIKNTAYQELSATRFSLPISLLRTRELIMEEFRPTLHKYGITEQQWHVLRVIDEATAPTTATHIAERACLLPPSITRILRHLEKLGYIKTMRDSQDGRRIMLSLTEKGKNFMNQVASETVEIFHYLRNVVGAQRWEILINLLAEIRDDIHEERPQKDKQKRLNAKKLNTKI